MMAILDLEVPKAAWKTGWTKTMEGVGCWVPPPQKNPFRDGWVGWLRIFCLETKRFLVAHQSKVFSNSSSVLPNKHPWGYPRFGYKEIPTQIVLFWSVAKALFLGGGGGRSDSHDKSEIWNRWMNMKMTFAIAASPSTFDSSRSVD